jgi:outer membrane protein insertion porin family
VCDLPEEASAPAPESVFVDSPPWGSRVERVDVRGLRRVPEAIVRGVLGLRSGEALDEGRLRRDVLALHELEVFSDILAETTPMGDSVRLAFVVREHPLVGRVEVRGASGVGPGRFVPVAPGEIHEPERVARSARDWQTGLADTGYLDARVRATAHRDGPSTVGVCYRVEAGPRFVLDALRFTGNERVPSGELLGKIDDHDGRANAPGKPYRPDLLRADLLHLTALYYDRGHLDVRLGEPVVRRDPRSGRLTVEIPVREGSVYRVGAAECRGAPRRDLAECRRLLGVARGDVFDRSAIHAGLERVRARFTTSRGQPNVTPDTQTHPERATVDLTVDVELAK